MSAIDACLQANVKYAAGFSKGQLAAPPGREIAIVTCMDARIDPAAMLGLEEGDAHVVRNAGGIVTDDVVRSLTISQRMLGTREIMIVQHTGCGMMSFEDGEVAEAIHQEVGVRLPFALGAFRDLEENVRRSVADLSASPFLPHVGAVRGFVYEVESGRLREVH